MQLHYPCIDYLSTAAQRNALPFKCHFLAVPKCSSWRRDGNTTTATYRNVAAVEYEQGLIVNFFLPQSYKKYATVFQSKYQLNSFVISLPPGLFINSYLNDPNGPWNGFCLTILNNTDRVDQFCAGETTIDFIPPMEFSLQGNLSRWSILPPEPHRTYDLDLTHDSGNSNRYIGIGFTNMNSTIVGAKAWTMCPVDL